MNNTDLVASWSTWQYAQSLSKRTVSERAVTVRRMASWCDLDPAHATTDDVVTWLAEAGPEWKASTRHTFHSHLVAWFLWLQKMGHRADNPMTVVGKPRRPRADPHPVADAHMPRLLAQRMHKRTRVMILLIALAGFRVHEVAKVRGEHFDLVGRTVTVVGKGGVRAVLPLHPLLVEAAWTMPRQGWWFPANATRTGHVLARSVGTIVKQVMIRAEVPGSAHSIRHWYGTTLVDSNVDLRTTQELLRHASLATTQIYTKIADHRKASGIDTLDPWRSENKPLDDAVAILRHHSPAATESYLDNAA
ncbi:tyrosine recombinase [Rhodococcoides fascians]|uniref:tyrosine-type recombinase/integrase n=1 Tax=Rhodococcoides fascians TaxID=1828 RepID=UPI000B9B3876|nr:tyrosine-type recombinase/integrase [Rhodococcus fascians]OZE89999.1 tyrosine recombinase [Rhodococcus fascians]OZF18306.1 tyrosine recombinase [Rhodococcus fascians]OZF21757.1 tyrosine recombinase [Rhodococcus fascians]OZF67382.1 tyrosine recombinase [Rhodococcus fascians]OZF70572.1 tyrosine recombinase [Rhodococcus fascians]